MLSTLVTPVAVLTAVYLLIHLGLFRQTTVGFIAVLIGVPLMLLYLNLLHQLSAVVMAAWLGSRQVRTALGLVAVFALVAAAPAALVMRQLVAPSAP